MEPIEGVGEKQRAKTFCNICLLSAQLNGRASSAQIHTGYGPILHICRHLKLGVWGWEWETARTLPT